MAIDTYDNLKSEIVNHLDQADLLTDVDTFIDLAEARLRRDVRIRELLVRDEMVIYDRFTDLPDDFMDIKYLRLKSPTTTAGRRFLDGFSELTVNEMTSMSTNTTRRPCYFALWSSEIEVDSDPDVGYDAEIAYYKTFTPLSDSNTSNEILAKAGDVYLYACLLATAPYLLNDERLVTWGNLYTQAKDALNLTERVARRSGPVIARAAGA